MRIVKPLIAIALGALVGAGVSIGATRTTVAKSWQLTPSFDGRQYSNYPLGDKASGYVTTPTILYTDTVQGQTSGCDDPSTGKGTFLTIFGLSFGNTDLLGTASGARVYLRTTSGPGAWQEVANYRYLSTAITFTRTQQQVLSVQLGALGSPAPGSVMDLRVLVNGNESILSSALTIQPGDCYFVALTGNDSTGVKNTLTSPYRYLQNGSTGTTTCLTANFTGIWATGKLKAGDHIYIRAGNYTDAVGCNTNWMKIGAQHGAAPGAASDGTTGYIHISAYPGDKKCDAGSCTAVDSSGNSMEYVAYSGNTKGGIQGPDTARAALGGGKYFSFSNLHISSPVGSVSDGAPMNLQNGADNWRVVGNELGPWPQVTTGLAAGLAGQGAGVYALGNYVHGIAGDGGLTNHGIYIGDSGGSYSQTSSNWTVAYNWIVDVTDGSCVQINATSVSTPMSGMSIHHNWMENCNRNALAISTAVSTLDFYNNVVYGVNGQSVRLEQNPVGTAINITHNLFYQIAHSVSATSTVLFDNCGVSCGGAITVGSVKIQHNTIVMNSAASTMTFVNGFSIADTAVTIQENVWYDTAGTATRPSNEVNSVTGCTGAGGCNPLITSVLTKNFTVTAGSPTLGASSQAEVLAVPTDFYGVARPVTGTGAPGGTKNDVGPFQGIGL